MLSIALLYRHGQKVARPKKNKYQKLDKNLMNMIRSNQPLLFFYAMFAANDLMSAPKNQGKKLK